MDGKRSAKRFERAVVACEVELEPIFDATAEATEAAIVDALFAATTVRGFAGHIRHALTEIAPDWAELVP